MVAPVEVLLHADERERSLRDDVRAGLTATPTGAETLVELGSGSSRKTRLLLDALTDAGTLRRFVACRDRFGADLAAAGLAEAAWWTDRAGEFALCLAAPA